MTQAAALAAYGSNSPSNRNRIINGGMVFDQRNNGASVTPTSSGYTLDRYYCFMDAASKYSVQQSTNAPVGFTNSMLFTSTSAYTIGTGEAFGFRQVIEGFNVADLGWGTANAKTVTLSFWVRSSLTGTFGGVIRNASNNRTYPFTYSISTANNWEQKAITIAGDTSGTWLTTNGAGLAVQFGLGIDASISGTAGSWAGTGYWGATGAINLLATSGATFYITGVQLEEGSVATPFEHRQYGQELALCQRYYWKTSGASANNYVGAGFCDTSTNVATIVSYPVRMRAIPTLQTSGTASDYEIRWAGANITTCNTVPTGTDRTEMFARIDATVSGGLTTGYGGLVRNANTNGFFAYTAEL